MRYFLIECIKMNRTILPRFLPFKKVWEKKWRRKYKTAEFHLNFERFYLKIASNNPNYYYNTVEYASNYPNIFFFIKKILLVSALVLYIAKKSFFCVKTRKKS